MCMRHTAAVRVAVAPVFATVVADLADAIVAVAVAAAAIVLK